MIARELARCHGVDEARVDLAMAAHDLARAVDGPGLLERARRHRIRPNFAERHHPMLLHGPIAAVWLERENGVADGQVLEAVRYHTTGKRGIGPVAKVVFLADKLDPEKVGRYPYLKNIGSLAYQSLDQALLEYLNHELGYLLGEGRLIHPGSVGLRNDLTVALSRRRPG